MKLRVVERPWDIARRRYAVECLRWEIDGEQGWGIEAFAATPLESQLIMQRMGKARIISTTSKEG